MSESEAYKKRVCVREWFFSKALLPLPVSAGNNTCSSPIPSTHTSDIMPVPQSTCRSEEYATVSDSCSHKEVYLLVYPPRNNDASRHDLHWSLAWEVSDGHWKYIQVNARREEDVPGNMIRAQYCEYCGACTKSQDGTSAVGARLFSLGRLSRQSRQRIEEIARSVPACPPDGLWNCQHWILGVLRRVADDGMIYQRVLEDTIGCAYNGESSSSPMSSCL